MKWSVQQHFPPPNGATLEIATMIKSNIAEAQEATWIDPNPRGLDPAQVLGMIGEVIYRATAPARVRMPMQVRTVANDSTGQIEVRLCPHGKPLDAERTWLSIKPVK